MGMWEERWSENWQQTIKCVYIVYKLEYVLFLILYIFFEMTMLMLILFNNIVTTYMFALLHTFFADISSIF
jgi:hypothetical protein